MKIMLIENAKHEDLIAVLQHLNATAAVVENAPAKSEAAPAAEIAEAPVKAEPKTEETQKAEVESIEEPTKAEPVEAPAEEKTTEEPRAKKTPQRGRRKKQEEKAPVDEAPKAEEPAEESAEEPAEEPVEEVAEEKEPTPDVSRTDVISLGKKLVKNGHSKEVTKLMKETYGATKFSDISDDQLPEVYLKFKKIDNDDAA